MIIKKIDILQHMEHILHTATNINTCKQMLHMLAVDKCKHMLQMLGCVLTKCKHVLHVLAA